MVQEARFPVPLIGTGVQRDRSACGIDDEIAVVGSVQREQRHVHRPCILNAAVSSAYEIQA